MREPFHTLIWNASIGYNDSWSQVDPEVLEKFAELIVRECANIAADRDALDIYEEIREHFGVEE